MITAREARQQTELRQQAQLEDAKLTAITEWNCSIEPEIHTAIQFGLSSITYRLNKENLYDLPFQIFESALRELVVEILGFSMYAQENDTFVLINIHW